MEDNSELVLYSYRRCPFAMRVRLTLHEKSIPFKVVEEDLKNFSPALRALHPEAKVPVLVQGKMVVYESAIITEYLEDKYPHISLLSKNANERAEMRLLTYWCNTQFKPDLDRFKYKTSRFSESECLGVEERIAQHLIKLENKLSPNAWLVGERYSLADIHIFPFVRQLFKVKEAVPFFTDKLSLTKWLDTISSRPAFLKTMER